MRKEEVTLADEVHVWTSWYGAYLGLVVKIDTSGKKTRLWVMLKKKISRGWLSRCYQFNDTISVGIQSARKPRQADRDAIDLFKRFI